MFLNEVTIIVEVLNEAKHSFALYTPERTKQRWPIRLAAATEQEMHDWVMLGISHVKLAVSAIKHRIQSLKCQHCILTLGATHLCFKFRYLNHVIKLI